MTTTRKSRPLLSRPLLRNRHLLLRPAPLPAALAAIGFCTLLFSGPMVAQAQQLPTGGNVVSGSASIQNTSATQQVITQGSNKAIINWQGFSIGQGNSVQFVQPGANSVVLNRVVGNDPSSIFGSLSANGQVFLVNPQGIYFSPTASLNVAGLVASTLNIRDDDFLAGRYSFSRDPNSPATASVINEGLIRARDGGYVVLAGDYAANRGIVEARLGTVALAAGSKVTLDLQGDSLINLAVNEKTVAALAGVANSGELNADGGRVVMTAAVARDLAGTVVNNTGVIRASGTVARDGAIYLVGDGGDVSSSGSLDVSGARGGSATIQSTGTTLVSGSVDASGSAGNGGTVQVLGQYAGLTGNANIDASGATGGGTVLVGGDYQGKNSAVQNAQRSYVGADAVIKADATQNGDGGKVIVWADDVTRYAGTISARGGAEGGNGGFAEVSGKESLVYNGTADLRAPLGATGTLLLDPKNIRITAGGADAVAGNGIFSDNAAGTSDLSAANVVAAMNGANLILQANNDITVETDVNVAAGAGTAGQDLTLQAGRHIILAATPDTATPANSTGAVTITMNGGAFNATVNDAAAAPTSANRDPGAAQFLMATGSAITGATGGVSIIQGNLSADSSGATSVNDNTGAFNLANISGGPTTISAFNNINVNGALNSGGNAINITADGDLNVAATGSITSGAGTATLKTTEDLNADASINLAGNISASAVALHSADAITQTTGGITATNLLVRAASGSTDDAVVLDGNNHVGTIAAAKNDTVPGAGGISTFTFNNGTNTLTVGAVTVDSVTVTGITAIPTPPATGRVTLTAGDLVIDQAITTDTGKGVVTLQPFGNANVNIVDTGATTGFGLTQAELNRITTGTLRVGTTTGSGNLTVGGTAAVTNGSNWSSLILRAGSGGISQTQAITVTNLGVESAGNVALTNAGNDAQAFAASVTGGATLQYTDANALTVDSVGLNGPDLIPGVTVSGITTGNANATLNTGDAMTISSNVAVGNGVLTLNVTQNGATQSGGSAITTSATGGVRLLGNPANTNNFNLNQNNDIANLAADTNGSVTFRNVSATPLTVGSVGGTSGITTRGSAVTLIADEMVFSQNINAGAGSVTLTSNDAARAINLGTNAAGLNFTDATLERVVTSGQLTIGDNAHTGAITVSGQTVNPSQATGGIVLRNVNSFINIDSVLSAGASSVTLVADGGDPTTATSGVITQGASGGIVANTLSTSSKGGTTLLGSSNAVSNFSGFESGANDIQLANTGNLVINGIGLGTNDDVRHVAIDTTGSLTTNGLITTQATNSNVTLGSGGAMTLTQDINPGSTGTLTLSADGAVNLTGKIVANTNSGSGSVANLLLTRRTLGGNGAFTLNNAANNVDSIAASINGSLSYTDANAFAVDSVNGVNGINTNGHAVTLESKLASGGNIVLNQSVIASNATVDLKAAGISSGAGAGITANGLALRDSDTGVASPMGTYTLDGVNDVANLAASIKGNLTYADNSSFNVSAVNGVNGITTNGGNVALSGNGVMGISGNITTSGAAIALSSTAGIIQSGGAITGSTLQATGAGNITLAQGGNNVGTFAANTTGAVTYADGDALTVGTVNGVNGTISGITSGNNDISVTANGALNVTQHVNAGTGDVTLTTLEASGANTDNITLNATPDVLTGDTVRLVSADGINHVAGNINATNLFTQAESGSNVSATVSGEYWIDVAGLTNFTKNVAANRVVIWSSSGSPTVNQTGGIITANELVFMSRDGNPVFNFNQANNVSTLAATNSYSGFFWGLLNSSATVNFTNSTALNVGLINTSSFAGSVQGITTNNANVTLNTAGALTLNEKINAGSGNVSLSATAGGITQSAFAPITASILDISSPGGAVNLGTASNNVTALNSVNVTGSSFSFREAGNIELRGAINVSNAGPVNVNITAPGNLDMTGTGSINAVSTGNAAPAIVTLRGADRITLTGPIVATGGGSGSGVNAGVNLLSANGPVTMNFGAGIFATDNGPATAAAAAPHSAEVAITSGSRNAGVANCTHNDVCISTVGNINATSSNGRAVIDVFGQGDAGDGVRVVGALTATGQTRPLINLDAKTQDSDGNELTSTGNVNIGATVTVNSTSSTAVNTLADSVIGGIAVNGRNITVGAKLESRHSDGVSRAQDGISINSVRQNININADIVTTSNGGIGITTGGNGTISGPGVIQAQNVNLVAPKSQGTFDVTTRIQPPAGIPGSGNLNVLGGRNTKINNLSAETLITALGFIDRSQDPVNPDLPIGNLSLKTAGTLQIATLDAYNTDFSESNPVRIELASDNFVVFPGTISTPSYSEITLRPYTDTKEIFVRNSADPSLPGVVYTAAPLLGLLQQFNPDAKLIIGGPNHKGDITVGGDGVFTLGNMHLVFETGEDGRVVKNFFSSDGNVYHPEPLNPYPGNIFAPYPGPAVNDGIGKLTSDKVQLIEKGNFQPSPGVTINGSCPAPCPGGSPGQGAITVSGDTDTGGGGGSDDSGGGGGGGGGGGTSTGGTDLGGPADTGTTTAAGTGGTGGGGSTTPADTTTVGGGTGGDPSSGTGGGVVADGGGTLSGPGDGTVTTTTTTDTTQAEDGGGIIAGDNTTTTTTTTTTGPDDTTTTSTTTTTGPDDTTTTSTTTTTGPDDTTTTTTNTTGPGPGSDGPTEGGGSGGTLAGDPGDDTTGTTSDGLPSGGGTLADGSGSDGTGSGTGTDLAGDGSGDGTIGGGDGSDTFGGGANGSGLAGDSSSGAGGDGLADGSGGSGLGGDGGATGGSSLADGSGSAGGGDGSGLSGAGGGDGSLSGGASGGSLAGDGSSDGTGGGFAGAGGAGSGSGGADGTGVTGDGLASGGATGGGSLADGSGSASGGTGLAGGGNDGSAGGSGGNLAGSDGSSGANGSGIGGDSLAGGATGGSGLADGSGNASGGTGLAGGSGSDGSSGSSGGIFAGSGSSNGADGSGIGGDSLVGGATGGSLADGSGNASGGTGLAGGSGSDGSSGSSGGNFAGSGSSNGADGTGVGGDSLAGGATGDSLADGSGNASGGTGLAGGTGSSGGSDGSAGDTGNNLAGSGSGLSDGGFAGGAGGGSGAGDSGTAGGDTGIAGSGNGLAGGQGGLLAGGGGSSSTGLGDGSAGGAGGSNTAGEAGGPPGDGSGGAGGSNIFADGTTGSGSAPGAGTGDGTTVGSGTGLAGEMRGGATGGGISVDAGQADSRNPDAAVDEGDMLARSGTGVDGGFRGGASGGNTITNAGEAQSRDPATNTRSPDNVARNGTAVGGPDADTPDVVDVRFRGGATGGKATADAGDSSADSSGKSGKDEERDRFFEDERDAQRIRLVGGSRLISVQGEGVNLLQDNRPAP